MIYIDIITKLDKKAKERKERGARLVNQLTDSNEYNDTKSLRF